MEADMKVFAAAVALGLAALGLSLGGTAARAEVNYPWCIVTGGPDGGVYSCGFTSFAQCQQTRIGTDMCVSNPRYQPAAPRGRR
jgi:hypothetical protein